jgi:transporter family protein
MTLSGLLIGGPIPAVCLGLGTQFMWASLDAGASIPFTWRSWAASWRCSAGRPRCIGFDHRTIDQQQRSHAVLVGGVVFSEWSNLNISLVALGTLLICAGATVISLSR